MIRPTKIALLLTLFLPSAIYVAFSASSMSAGLLLCALIWAVSDFFLEAGPFKVQRSDVRRLAILAVVIVLLFIHAAIANSQLGGVDFVRFFSSCALLMLVFVGAQAASRKLLRTPTAVLVETADIALIVLTAIGVAAVFGAPSIGPQATVKPVVIFSEPSVFACAYMPVLLFRAAVSKQIGKLGLLAVAFLLAVVLQSFTMIIEVIIVSALLLRRVTLVIMIFVVAIGLVALDLTYYADRLNFSSESDNISTLVLLQGWQNAILDFQSTYGFGVGYQQFGIVGSVGDISARISELAGDYINLFDGGSTAAKLIGEFGILGILTVISFMILAYRCVNFIRGTQSHPVHHDIRKIFFYSLIVTYSFELLIRGSGYFTPGGFLALTALISIYSSRVPKTSKDIGGQRKHRLATAG